MTASDTETMLLKGEIIEHFISGLELDILQSQRIIKNLEDKLSFELHKVKTYMVVIENLKTNVLRLH